MKSPREFRQSDTLIDMIEDDYNIIPYLSRFSIPLGVSSETIAEVCQKEGVDVDALLLILNFIRIGVINRKAVNNVSPIAVVDFLKNSHDYYLIYKFPHIRKNLTEALETEYSDINPSIIRFFDGFVEKVEIHFQYEEETVFPYVRSLVSGKETGYAISTFKKHHDEVVGALSELKSIILRYYRTSVPNRMYDVLVDLYNCEEDLESHNNIENSLLIPMVEIIEKRNKQ